MFIKESKPYIRRIVKDDFCFFMIDTNGESVSGIYYTPSLENLLAFICKYLTDFEGCYISQSSGQREP